MFASEEASMRVREEIYTEKTTLTVLQRLTVLVLQYSKKQVFYLCGILVLHTFVRARTHNDGRLERKYNSYASYLEPLHSSTTNTLILTPLAASSANAR